MNIQTISIVVPTKGCVNNCRFCVSRMHGNDYENSFDRFQIKKRIKYAVSNGVNTCVVTGTGEPLQNREFLLKLQEIFEEMDHPFPNVEFQTTGAMLETVVKMASGTRFFYTDHLKALGVNTVTLSVSDVFDSSNNSAIVGIPERYGFLLEDICRTIKTRGFNLRLSLNMTNVYDGKSAEQVLRACKNLLADQVTFRKLYSSDDGSEQSVWVRENRCKDETLDGVIRYVKGTPLYDKKTKKKRFTGGAGRRLYRLPFGATVYSVMGMSVVVDDNCMGRDEYEKLKYVILRENGKLYSQWDDEGSLIF